MAVDTSPLYRHQVVIDKGQIDGVYEGQPVINEKGSRRLSLSPGCS